MDGFYVVYNQDLGYYLKQLCDQSASQSTLLGVFLH